MFQPANFTAAARPCRHCMQQLTTIASSLGPSLDPLPQMSPARNMNKEFWPLRVVAAVGSAARSPSSLESRGVGPGQPVPTIGIEQQLCYPSFATARAVRTPPAAANVARQPPTQVWRAD
ncbi:hypothetical protein AAHA92_28914 [Salvia divinorum]|uniref:Uncharacterized protein n=1 Tax=Salvia divinorum TaxID=28513 RepID=A0ABD1FZG4_SALDI